MANFEKLKDSMRASIKQNGNKEITGNVLQTALLSIINSILGSSYNAVNRLYRGIATPDTDPGSYTDEEVFYIASKPGTYSHFHNLDTAIEADNKIHIIYNDINSDDWFEEALDLTEFIPALKPLSLIGDSSISIGDRNEDSSGEKDSNSLAIGADNKVNSFYGLAVGTGNKVDSFYGLAAGNQNTVSEESAQALGYKCTASGSSSHAEGESCTASGSSSHAEGYKCKASGSSSHAEGQNCTASGSFSHVEGQSCTALANGSHASGIYSATSPSGTCAFAHGTGLMAAANSEFVIGTYNFYNFKAVTPKFVIGIGTTDNNRRNALVVTADGQIYVVGVGGYEGQDIEGDMSPLQNFFN